MARLSKAKLEKREMIEEFKRLFKSHPTIAIADLYKVGSSQLHKIRRKFRGVALLRVAKNTLVKRALKELGGELEALSKYMEGQNILIFSKENPFKLAKMLEEAKVPSPARAGDIAPEDIVVPEGNTGLPPGPILSEFSEVGLPARISSGSIWITRTTVVAKKGEVISSRLASVLTRLGIKPIFIGLSLKAAFSEGLLFPAEALKLDLEALRSDIAKAWEDAFKLALAVDYPTAETAPVLLAKGYKTALTLAILAGYITAETLPMLVQRALSEASVLNSLTFKAEERKVEKEEAPKKEEEEEELGLAALFG